MKITLEFLLNLWVLQSVIPNWSIRLSSTIITVKVSHLRGNSSLSLMSGFVVAIKTTLNLINSMIKGTTTDSLTL